MKAAAGRRLTITALRYNPREPERAPHMQSYTIEEADGMTLYIALIEIHERQDPSLQFDFVCRAGVCGCCAMVINGRPGLACRTLTKSLGPEITLAPPITLLGVATICMPLPRLGIAVVPVGSVPT